MEEKTAYASAAIGSVISLLNICLKAAEDAQDGSVNQYLEGRISALKDAISYAEVARRAWE